MGPRSAASFFAVLFWDRERHSWIRSGRSRSPLASFGRPQCRDGSGLPPCPPQHQKCSDLGLSPIGTRAEKAPSIMRDHPLHQSHLLSAPRLSLGKEANTPLAHSRGGFYYDGLLIDGPRGRPFALAFLNRLESSSHDFKCAKAGKIVPTVASEGSPRKT